MFLVIENFFLKISIKVLNLTSHFTPFYMMWSNFAIEFFLTQLILIFVIYKLFLNNSYFKLILNTMVVICVLCALLCLSQLELFACFMFLAEFSILIFFYCLFLHLKISVAQKTTNSLIYFQKMFSIIVCFFLIVTNNYILTLDDVNLFAVNVYNLMINFFLNDLSFFFFFWTKHNILMHLIIGLLLTFLTIFLFFTVNIYFFLNLKKQNIFAQQNFKLHNLKHYFENTAKVVQKIFSNK